MVQPETFNNQKSPPLEDGAKVDEAAIKKFTIDNGPAFARGHQMSWRVTAVIANDKARHRIFRPNRRRIISSTAFSRSLVNFGSPSGPEQCPLHP
jgi:hypothetical protein